MVRVGGSRIRFLVGIDEAGRGPLAGPAAVAAVVVDLRRLKNYKRLLHGIKDSKKLSFSQREEWFARLQKWKTARKFDFAVSTVGNRVIDKLGIVQSVRLAVCRSILKLKLNSDRTLILLDGSLRASRRFIFQKTIIHGDDIEPIISLASIAAKVTRDRLMIRFSKIFPNYDFERHKGYGTSLHFGGLKKFGLSPLHRRSFLLQ